METTTTETFGCLPRWGSMGEEEFEALRRQLLPGETIALVRREHNGDQTFIQLETGENFRKGGGHVLEGECSVPLTNIAVPMPFYGIFDWCADRRTLTQSSGGRPGDRANHSIVALSVRDLEGLRYGQALFYEIVGQGSASSALLKAFCAEHAQEFTESVCGLYDKWYREDYVLLPWR